MQRVLFIGGAGYIGSYLVRYFRHRAWPVKSVDLGWYQIPAQIEAQNLQLDYIHLTPRILNLYDSFVVTAAHSSVPLCQGDPYGAMENNIANFARLLKNITGMGKKLIFMSSSCIYSQTGNRAAIETDTLPPPVDHLTLTKKTIEHYARLSGVETYALRLGSVCGWSPNFREDLMLNSMVRAGVNRQNIKVSSPNNYRPILLLDDLGPAVEAILRGKDQRGEYNLSSFNVKIGDLAKEVQQQFPGTILEEYDGGPTYSFSMDCGKFLRAYPGITFSTLPQAIASAAQPLQLTGRRDCPEGWTYNGNYP